MTTSRVLLASHRGLYGHISRASSYEFEGLIEEIDDVDLAVPRTEKKGAGSSKTKEVVQKRALDFIQRRTGADVKLPEPIAKAKVSQQYDLFFTTVLSCGDLTYLQHVDGWRENCRVAIVWIEEFWLLLLKHRKMLSLLEPFDHVIVGAAGTAPELAKAIGKPVHHGAPGVDTKVFCPLPNPPGRTIDVYSMGRRSEDTHRVLLERTRTSNFFYLHDTVKLRDFINDYAEHRTLVSNFAKRSKFFITYKSKPNQQGHTGGQEEFGQRFFEASAAGAVLLGEPPRNDTFPEYFDWEKTGVTCPWGSTDVNDIIDEASKDEARMMQIRRDNVENALRRHDWVYRWERVLQLAGLEPTDAMNARKAELTARADTVQSAATV